MTERRAGGEVRISDRTLTGTAMRFGEISPDFRERFEPGAMGLLTRWKVRRAGVIA